MRRFPVLSLLLWSAVGCGGDTGKQLPDAPDPQSDLQMSGGAIAFGDADCGTTSEPKTLSFHNIGTSPLTWTATIDGGGFAIASGASGKALPGEPGAIAITATVPATAVVGQPVTATLRIETNASNPVIEFALSVTPHGGSLRVGSRDVDFGQAQLTEALTQDLEISNVGDRAIDVALGHPANPAFTATWDGAPTAVSLDPTVALSGAVARFQPTAVGMQIDNVPIIASGPVCAGDMPAIVVTGEGTTAQVTVTPPTLQFGTTACGSTAQPRQVTIRNAFHFAIHYTAQITSGPYAIAAGQATGTVGANSSVTITVNASAVPAAPASLGANALAGAMTVTTDAPGIDPAQLAIAQGASGVVLALTPNPPATIAFGNVVAGTPASRPYSVKNTGNVVAAVTVGVTGSGFTATTPGGGTVPANGTDTAATVTETVVQRGALTGTLTLSTSTALCQPAAPGALALTATGRAPVAVIGTAPAMPATCGVATPPSVNVSVQNTGDEPLTIPSATASGGFAVISAFPMTIAAGASASIAVRPPVAQVGIDIAGTVKTGTLSFTTNEIGTPTRSVSLSSTVTGAQLTLTPAPGSTLAFGDVAVGTPVSKPYSVRNAGNLAATVTVATTGPGFSATTPSGGTIPTGGVDQTANVTQTVAQHGALTGTLTVSSTTAQCNAALGPVTLTATGRTPGAVIGTAPPMPATCGVATPPSVNISVQNTGDGPLTIPSATATGGFVVTSTFPMTIAAGATGNIAVRPPAAQVGVDVAGTVRTGTLSITTNEIGSPSHSVSLSSTVTGAQLALTPPPGSTIGFGDVNAGSPVTRTYSVRNTGNLAATLNVATTGPGFSATAPSGSDPNGTVTETVVQRGLVTGTLTVSSPAAQCNPTLGAVNLAANAHAPTAVIATAPAMTSTCGVATPPSVNVSIQNTGDGPLTIPSANATGGFVVASTFPMTIAAGATGSITVQPPAAQPGDAAGAVKTGTLSFTTNEIGNPTRTASLSSTVTGAQLVLTPTPGATIAFGDVSVGTPVTKNYSLRNTGNLAATVTVATTGSGFSAVRPNGGTIPTGGTDQTGTVTETVAQHGALTGTLTVSSATAHCIPTPGAVNLTATGRTPTAVVGTAPAMPATCGVAAPPSVNVSVQNTGDGPLTIPSATATNGFVVTSTFPMTIAPGATGNIAVRPPAAQVGTDTAGTVKTGTLSITTNELGSPARNVSLSSTVTGAQLALTPAPPATIAFGDVSVGNPVSRNYSVRNAGNVAATVTVATTGPGFSATRPNGGTIPTGGVDQTANVTQTVTQHGAVSGTLTVSSTTAQCNAALGALNLTATGRTPTAVVGTAPAAPATCGVATPPSVNVSVQNTGDAALIIPSATATGNFVVTSTFPMTIAAGATGNIAVRPPRAVVGTDRAGAIRTGTLSFTTNELGNPTRNVSLSSTATGAELVVTPAPGSTIAFGTVNAGTPVNRSYSVRNTGNVAATVTVATTGPGFSAVRPNGGTIPTGGVDQTANATQTVAQRGAVTGTLTVSSATAQCTAAPGAVNLTATGHAPVAVIGLVPTMSATCGAGTPNAVSVPIQNTGDGPLTINATADNGFVVTPSALTIAAGASSSLSVRPPAAVIGTDVGGSTIEGTLTITTNALANATQHLALASTVFGANIRLLDALGRPISAVTFTANQQCPAAQTIFVQNFGNTPTSVAITTANFDLFRFDDFVPSTFIPGGSAVSHALAVWTPSHNNVCNGAETVQYTATGPICTVLPVNLQASFNITGLGSCFCT